MLRLHLNQSIGNPPDGCFPSAVDLTPFGTAKLAAKWQDGPCPDSQMVMQRLPGESGSERQHADAGTRPRVRLLADAEPLADQRQADLFAPTGG